MLRVYCIARRVEPVDISLRGCTYTAYLVHSTSSLSRWRIASWTSDWASKWYRRSPTLDYGPLCSPGGRPTSRNYPRTLHVPRNGDRPWGQTPVSKCMWTGEYCALRKRSYSGSEGQKLPVSGGRERKAKSHSRDRLESLLRLVTSQETTHRRLEVTWILTIPPRLMCVLLRAVTYRSRVTGTPLLPRFAVINSVFFFLLMHSFMPEAGFLPQSPGGVT